MSDEFEPLLDDADLEPGLRGGLQALKAESVDYDVTAGAARFEASLGPAAATGTAAAATSKTLLWVVVGVVLAAAAVAAWALRGDSPEAQEYASLPVVSRDPAPGEDVPPTAAAVPALEQLQEPASAPDSTQDAEPPSGAAEAREGEPPPKKTARIPRKPKTKAPAEPHGPDTLRAEMRATHAAKTKLAADPGEALRLARAASKAYPEGVFGPERDGIIVLALFATGAVEEAERRAKSYLRRHPRGAHAQRIRAALQK